MRDRIRLGTRGSQLAMTQSGMVADALSLATGVRVDLVVIRTKGDDVADRPLQMVGGKGLFTKEIEDALLADEVDVRVADIGDHAHVGVAFGVHVQDLSGALFQSDGQREFQDARRGLEHAFQHLLGIPEFFEGVS
jgi:hypothetical protein